MAAEVPEDRAVQRVLGAVVQRDGAGVDLGYELPNGDPAQMSVSEFVGALLAQELKDGSGLP